VANQVDYRDPTPNNFPQDYDPAKVDSRVKLRSESIKHKQKGKHTREAMYQAREIGSVTANEAKETAIDTASRQDESEKKVQDTSDNVNNVLAEITKNSGDTAAPEVIAARTDEKGVEHDTIGERINSINEPIFIPNREADIGGDTTSDNLNQFTNKIDETKFNIAVITDSHYQDVYPEATDYPCGDKSLTHLANFMDIANHTDIAIALGDNTGGNYKEKAISYADESLYADRLLYTPVKGDVAIVPGNHDDGSPAVYISKKTGKPYGILTENDMAKIFHTNERIFDEERDGDSLYFYKDYPDKKIRVVVLFAEDVPEDEVDGAGVIKYPRWLWHGFRQKQLDWLANTALKNVPADYHTVILNHAPINGFGWTDSDTNAKHVNDDLITGIINAFAHGGYFAQSSSSEWANTGWNAAITSDFSDQGARTLVGWFCGHKHTQKRYDMSGFMMQLLINDVCLKANDIGTDNEGAVTVISIDTEAKTVNLLGWGRAKDDSFSYGGIQ